MHDLLLTALAALALCVSRALVRAVVTALFNKVVPAGTPRRGVRVECGKWVLTVTVERKEPAP